MLDGLIIFIGILFVFVKLPAVVMLRLLAFPLSLDAGITVLVYLAHMGTVSGLFAAAIAGVLVSLMTSITRYLVGYIKGNSYYPGVFYMLPPQHERRFFGSAVVPAGAKRKA